MKKHFEKISSLLLFFLIIYINVATTLISINIINTFAFSIGIIIFGFFSLLLYIYYIFCDKKPISKTSIILLILSFFMILSCFFSYDFKTSIWGFENRNEGLLVILSYYSIFILSTLVNKKHQKKIIILFLMFGLYQILIGTFQILKINNIFGYIRTNNWSNSFKYACGSFGNPNLYSIYILFCCIISTCFLFTNHQKRNLFLFSIPLYLYGLIIGNTLSCILSYIIVLFIIIIRKQKNINNKKNIFMICLCIIIIFLFACIIDSFCNHRIRKSINSNFIEIKNIFKNGINDTTGNNRIYLWKKTLLLLPKKIIMGVGIDNYAYINDGKAICTYNIKHESICFDKAHNEFIQILATSGIISFSLYIYFLFIIIKRNNHSILFFVIIGYIFQSLFNISYIQFTPIFYMFLGFFNIESKSIR